MRRYLKISQSICRVRKKIIERRIAKGKLPEAGANGKLLLLVKLLTGEVEVKLDDKNRASFHDLHLFDNIAKGQAIARLYPPKEGVEGVSALGERLPATPGTAATVNHDKTITMLAAMEGEPYQLLIAEEEGLVKQADGILTIQGEFEIGENLDFRYGNIDFVGAVKIKGDVQPGFSVRAKKGIFITGSVQGGTLEAIQGPIEVKGLVYGGEKSRIIAGDRFVADSVQEVFAEIRGEIVIKKEARDSILMSQTIIQMPTARLIGGKAYTVCGAEFRELGSETEKETVVILCSAVEASKSFSDLIAQIESHEQAEQLINLHLGPLGRKKIRLDMIKPEHRDKIGKLIKKQDSIKESKQKLNR
jgi:uncharacterized protein (DUF342 family)